MIHCNGESVVKMGKQLQYSTLQMQQAQNFFQTKYINKVYYHKLGN